MSERIIYGSTIPKEFLLTVESQSLGKYLSDACKEHANKIWLIDGEEIGKSITCGEVLNKSNRVAELLIRSGASIGSVVGIMSENSLHYPSVILATLNIGAVLSCMDPRNTKKIGSRYWTVFGPAIFKGKGETLSEIFFNGGFPASGRYTEVSKNELLHLLGTSKPSVLFTTSDLYERVKSVQTLCKFIQLVLDIDNVFGSEYDDDTISHFQYDAEAKIKATDTAVILHTSGSTGLPRGVMLSHKALMYSLELYKTKKVCTYDQIDIMASQSAMCHSSGLRLSLMALVLGKKFVFMKSLRHNEIAMLKCIETFKIDAAFFFPPFAAFLAEDARVDEYDMKSIKILSCSGDSLHSNIKQRVKSRLQCEFFNQYVLSETGLIIFDGLLSSLSSSKTDSTGHLLPGFIAKIVDPQTQDAVGPFQKGELCVKGPTLFNGYAGAGTTKDTFLSGGWFRTGDIAFYDNDEDFHVVGRLKQVIIYRTFNISPTEIEMVILQHPSVAAVGVIGAPHEVDGERVRAYIVKKCGSDITEEDVIQHVARNISRMKHLHGGCAFVDELPKTANGKIDRRTMKQWFVDHGI